MDEAELYGNRAIRPVEVRPLGSGPALRDGCGGASAPITGVAADVGDDLRAWSLGFGDVVSGVEYLGHGYILSGKGEKARDATKKERAVRVFKYILRTVERLL